MKIIYIKADLFTSTNSLAHCVSQDFHMGAGIARLFKSKFGLVNELIKKKKKLEK